MHCRLRSQRRVAMLEWLVAMAVQRNVETGVNIVFAFSSGCTPAPGCVRARARFLLVPSTSTEF